MAGSTPIYGLPYPQPSDLVANYPALGEDLAETLDEKLPTYAATAPGTPSVGQVWIDSDDNLGRVWTGSVWQIFSGAGPADFSDAATGTYTSGGINYKYKTYLSSGTLTITRTGVCDVLIIGGGGAGQRQTGLANGGGGGAGGYTLLNSFYIAATGSITITIGAGGAIDSTTGSASKFGSVVSFGGGTAGGTYYNSLSFNARGINGGSGGGGAGAGGNSRVAGSGFAGNNGGEGATTAGAGFGGGGGGGAGAVGAIGTASVGGDGGAGTADSLTGTSVTRAGGGGGARGSGSPGAGGAGGGGAGGTTTGTGGTANSGGGGGGAYDVNNSGAGGSGVVIIRVRTN